MMLNFPSSIGATRDLIQRCRNHIFFMQLLFSLVLTVLSSGCFTGGEIGSVISPTPSPKIDSSSPVPSEGARSEDERLVLDELDEFGSKFGIVGLRKKNLREADRELRIWIGFAPDETRGLIIESETATYLAPTGDIGRERSPAAKRLTGVSDWNSIWSNIEATGLLNFPPETPFEKVDPRNDSDVVIVEVKEGSNYRYILYGAPCYSRGANARALITAIKRVSERLQIDFYQCGNV